MSYDRRFQAPAAGPSRSRRPLYAPPPPPGRHNHSILGYWFPLITVSTIALGGLAAWIWSERDRDDDHHQDGKPPRPPIGPGGPYPTQGSQPYPGPPPPGPLPSQSAGPQGMPPPRPPPVGGEAASYYSANSASRDVLLQEAPDESSWFGQVRGAMRRTPSPQQFFDSASKHVGGAVAAAGAALGSIIEEDGQDVPRRDERVERRERREEREGFSDHERWSEETEEKQRGDEDVALETNRRVDAAVGQDGKMPPRKTVAVVVSADAASHDDDDDDDAAFNTEHASILSHLPEHETNSTNTYVLIYAPHLSSLPPIDYQPSAGAASGLGSSYSQISTPAVTPGSELQSISPRITPSDAPPSQQRAFDVLYLQAQTLVAHSSHILPFTTPTGFVQILRHLGPSLAYVSDTLSGPDGAAVAQLAGWVGHTILVAGDEGHGGLADTETEDEGARDERRWYDRSSMVGLGKEVEVVDAIRVGEDWSRRVGGRE